MVQQNKEKTVSEEGKGHPAPLPQNTKMRCNYTYFRRGLINPFWYKSGKKQVTPKKAIFS